MNNQNVNTANRIAVCAVIRSVVRLLDLGRHAVASFAANVQRPVFLAASKDVLGHVHEAGRRAGLSRGRAFEEFLTFVCCSLAGQTMKEEYLKTVAKGYRPEPFPPSSQSKVHCRRRAKVTNSISSKRQVSRSIERPNRIAVRASIRRGDDTELRLYDEPKLR